MTKRRRIIIFSVIICLLAWVGWLELKEYGESVSYRKSVWLLSEDMEYHLSVALESKAKGLGFEDCKLGQRKKNPRTSCGLFSLYGPQA